ncbi:MAG: spore gernimation protein [Tenericutes bacterium HGW-Tenericutes-4]|nr:MAG: spore gernimation protein [Tenericutes bacterium HGW-Tenericutes-4]
MIIYVVKSGDTLWDIASNFEVDVESIIEVNGIINPNHLVVGQALIIPVSSYTVKQGDSLYGISRKLGISFRQLVSYNNLDTDIPLQVGQVLLIPKPARVAIVSNAYVDAYITTPPQLEEVIVGAAPSLTYLSPFSYTVNRDGTLNPPNLYNIRELARSKNVSLIMAISNVDESGFSGELGKIIMENNDVQNRILTEAVKIAKEQGFKVVQFDFEYLPPETRKMYNRFLLKARDLFHRNGLLLSTALAPKVRDDQVGQWYEAHDYKAHGEIADFVVLMTYEWGYTYGLPLPVSPIRPVRDVVEYALSVMPANKILLGQNLYGYDWRAPYMVGGEPAVSLSPMEAVELAYSNNRSINFDDSAQAPYFYYKDQDGREHTVWFEDARSIEEKFDLIREYGLKGISYWRLGYDFPQNFFMLNNQFDIIKLR